MHYKVEPIIFCRALVCKTKQWLSKLLLNSLLYMYMYYIQNLSSCISKYFLSCLMKNQEFWICKINFWPKNLTLIMDDLSAFTSLVFVFLVHCTDFDHFYWCFSWMSDPHLKCLLKLSKSVNRQKITKKYANKADHPTFTSK